MVTTGVSKYNYKGWRSSSIDDQPNKEQNMLWLPLGTNSVYPRISPKWILKASDRTIWCSFLGTLKRGNRMLLNSFLHSFAKEHPTDDFTAKSYFAFFHDKELEDNTYIITDKLKAVDTAKIMLDSVFCLAPGGQHIESYRIYEAIDSGCIPIVEVANGVKGGKQFWCKDGLEPFNRSGHPPWVWMDDFSKLPELVTSMMNDPDELVLLQGRVMSWWADMKTQIMREMSETTR